METNPLTPQQREALIHQINRRMVRWPDEALVQFEALTRNPPRMAEELRGVESQAEPAPQPPSPEPAPPPAVQGHWRDLLPAIVPGGSITRREVFLAGAGGMAALLAASTGAGWFTSAIRLDIVLDKLGYRINALLSSCGKANAQKAILDQALQQYQARIRPADERLIMLRNLTNEVNTLYLSLDELESFKEIDPKNPFSIFMTLGDKIITFFTYLSKIPELVAACQDLMAQLDGWFAGPEDVDARLFRPVRETLFFLIDDIHTKAVDLQQIWKQEEA